MKFTIDCRRLEKAIQHEGTNGVSIAVKDEKLAWYVEASFQTDIKDVNCYISVPAYLLTDGDIKIGDEYEVSITKKDK
jgi:hypothetical protein